MNALDVVAAALLLLCIVAPLVEAAVARWEARHAFAESLRAIEEHAPIDATACNVIVLSAWKRRHERRQP